VRRIKTLEKTKYKSPNGKTETKYTLISHAGVYRPIHDFKLVKLNQPKDYHIQTETERVQKVLKSNMKKVRKKAEKTGFAPMDIFHRIGKKGKGKDVRYENHDDDDGNRDGPNSSGRESDGENMEGDSEGNDSDDSLELGLAKLGRTIGQDKDWSTRKRIGTGLDMVDLPATPTSNHKKPLSLRERLQYHDSDDDEEAVDGATLYSSMTTKFSSRISSPDNFESTLDSSTKTQRIKSFTKIKGLDSDSDSDSDELEFLGNSKAAKTISLNSDRVDAMNLSSLRDTDSDSESHKKNPKLPYANKAVKVDLLKGYQRRFPVKMQGKENLEPFTSSSTLNHIDDDLNHSDDDLPQSIFSGQKLKKIQGIPKKSELCKVSVAQNKAFLGEKFDSDDSMGFHSDTSLAKNQSSPKSSVAQDSLSVDDSSSESEFEVTTKRRENVVQNIDATSKSDHSASGHHSQLMRPSSTSHEIEDKSLSNKSTTSQKSKLNNSPIYIKENLHHKRKGKQGSETKHSNVSGMKPTLSFSIRKYN